MKKILLIFVFLATINCIAQPNPRRLPYSIDVQGTVEAEQFIGDGSLLTGVSGSGDMTKAVYDPLNIVQQIVGTTATQTLTNKTLTSPIINNPTGIDADDISQTSTTNKFVTTALINTWNAKQAPITLTTTGTSGLATFIGNILNIPNYSSVTEVNDLSSAVTWANVPDANITQSSVTQHQGALVLTASQTSNFDTEVENNTEVTANTAHRTNTSNPHSVTKTQVGLSNVDNTSDVNKPVSTAQQTALNLKANLISPSFTTPSLGVATATSINGATITSGTLNGNVTGTNTGDQTITLTGDITGSGTGSFATTIAAGAVDIAMLSATGTPSASTYLRGDNTWATVGGSGDVSKVGTPLDNQIGVWTGDGTIEGTTGLTYSGTNLQLTGDIGSTGNRITKGWFTDLQVTNPIAGSITGNAATVTTNANLTGVVTSTGNATAIADAALSIAKTSGLQAALDLKAPLASPTFTGTVTIPSTFTIGANNFIRSGAHALTLTTTGTTGITLPTSGTVYSTGTTDVSVADGGTGRSTGTTAYSLIATGTTATGAQQTLANGATTQILVGGGASALPVWTTATGTGAPVRETSPNLVTPVLGVATATSINGATITSGTLNGTVTGTNTGDQTSIVGITGTKAQFDTAVTDGNILYVGDVTSNATHTGEVTGSGALTIASGVVDSDNIVNGTIDEVDLDASVNASLDLADSSVQPSDNISTLTNDTGFIKSDNTGRTNAEEVTNQYAQSRADYATDGTPAAGTWVFIKDPLNADLLTAGSTTIDFIDANGYSVPSQFLDNTTADETVFDLVDMRVMDVVEIYLNQATEPTFVQTVEASPGTLDWTTDSLANTDLTLTVWKNGLGDIEKVYTKRP